jgi:outer membrane immunogenic protein
MFTRLLSTLAASLFAASAFAADLKVPPAYKAPVSVQDYGDPWSGFYVGAAAGYGWNRGSGNASATTEGGKGGSGVSSFETSPQGFIGGVHAGFGGHSGSWYFGAEGDIGIGTLDGTPQHPGLAFELNSKTRWATSIRGRLGYILMPNLMVYGTGGWSWVGSEFTATDAAGNGISTKPVLGGPVLGGGFEVAVTRNWLARLEYRHYFLSDANLASNGFITNGQVTIPAAFAANVSNNVDAVLAGLSYKF